MPDNGEDEIFQQAVERSDSTKQSNSETSAVAYSATILSDLMIRSARSNATNEEYKRQLTAARDFVKSFAVNDDPAYDEIVHQIEQLDNRLERFPDTPIESQREDEIIQIAKRIRDLYIRSDL